MESFSFDRNIIATKEFWSRLVRGICRIGKRLFIFTLRLLSFKRRRKVKVVEKVSHALYCERKKKELQTSHKYKNTLYKQNAVGGKKKVNKNWEKKSKKVKGERKFFFSTYTWKVVLLCLKINIQIKASSS